MKIPPPQRNIDSENSTKLADQAQTTTGAASHNRALYP
ncbi:hypothetical protein REQ_43970 [Prescottella equi 103S]|uniref:Uncharacterized protein n=1 Tax=Rhodococcus hoagii (strain 103S) TaxID=685727 RepID=A0A3S5YD01_RHOH1|nr:hypothetical protein REQ_43970 [Prescottella equi 103S]